MTIDTMFFNGDMEHLACAGTIDVTAISKNIKPPLFSGQPCNYTGFDCRKVCNDEFAALVRDECCTNQLGKDIWHRIIQKLHGVIGTAPDKAACFFQIAHVVLRQILQLNEASGKAPGAVRSVEHEHAMRTPVFTDTVLHGLILFDGAFCQLLAKKQGFSQVWRSILEHDGNFLLTERFDLHAVLCKPFFHLSNGIRILYTFFRRLGKRARFVLDENRVMETEAVLMVAANGKFYGGNYQGAPLALLDDGLMDVCIVPKISRLTMLGVIGKYQKGLHVSDQELRKLVTYTRCRTLEVEYDQPVTMCVDGETFRNDRITARVLPRSVRLLVPAAPEEENMDTKQ